MTKGRAERVTLRIQTDKKIELLPDKNRTARGGLCGECVGDPMGDAEACMAVAAG